jgi:hypothetical protein
MSSRASAAAPPALAQSKERPRSLAETVDQAGGGQEAQVTGDARLRLPQYGREVRYGQLRLGQQRKNAQARGFAGSLQRAIEGLERHVGKGGLQVGSVPF